MTTGKTIALTRRTLVGKVMSLLLNILTRLVITFLPRSKHLLISWLQWLQNIEFTSYIVGPPWLTISYIVVYTKEGNGNPLQYSCLENPMDGAWWAAVHGVMKSGTRLNNFTFTFHFHALEKEMATHSSVLAWRIPGMAEPSGLPFMGSHRVRHDWSNLAAAAAAAVYTY